MVYVVLDSGQVNGRSRAEVLVDLWVTRFHLLAAGCWPASGAHLTYSGGQVLLGGARADESLRDQAESVLLGLP